MRLKNLDDKTLSKIQEMMEVTFAGRDKLYSAANHLDDEERRDICRKLADHLAGHAIQLQQILKATGSDPKGPLDIHAIVDALLESIRSQSGDSGILDAAEKYTHEVKEDFDQAIEKTPDPDAREVLRHHRNGVAFGERVLRQMERPECEGGD